VDRVVRMNVKDVAFDVVLWGYEKRQVDERLHVLGAELAAAKNALQAAQERVATLEYEVSRSRSGGDPQPESNFGARVGKILTLAEEEAREVRNQADAAAAALVEQARAEVAAQRQRAEQEAAAWRAEADQIRKSVAREADEVYKAARVEAEQLVAQARTEADWLVTTATEHVQQREQANMHELHQLSRLRDEINAELYRAKEALDGLFGATGPTT
jgi:cell division septum initiation protein DivIVA